MENKPILSQSFTSIDKLTAATNDDGGGGRRNKGCLQSIRKRHVLAFYAFSGFFIAYTLRANLSVAIVDMSQTNFHTAPAFTSSSSSSASSTGDAVTSTPSSNNSGNADQQQSATQPMPRSEPWSPVLQGYILSSFFYGYILTQFPAASLTNKHGGKIYFGGGIGVCAVLSLLMPLSAYLGPGCLIGLRIVQGLAQGFIFPSMHCLWSKWAPPNERSRLATIAFSGSYIGSVAALSMGGLIGQHLNWQAIFYVFGSLGLVWTALWFYYVYESPSQHETIENDEKLYIESSLSYSDCQSEIPWSIIFRSLPVWAIVFAHFAENWGFYTMLTEMPTFFTDILHFNIDKAGLWSSLPYLIMAKMLYLSGYVSDKLIERKMTYTHVRKIFCVVGFTAQCFFMLLMTFITDATALIIFVSLAIGFGGLPWASFGVNHLDIGARYANVLMSVSNTFASLPGIISPTLTGHIIQGKRKSDWDYVFTISAIIYLLGAIVYGIFGTGEIQNWATRSSRDIEIKTHKGASPSSSAEAGGGATTTVIVKPTSIRDDGFEPVKNSSSTPKGKIDARDLGIITPPQNSSFSFSESSFSVPAPTTAGATAAAAASTINKH